MMASNKTFVLVGPTGSGKSTTGNIMINRSAESTSPFVTGDSANGITLNFQLHASDKVTVLDTIGFGDPQFTEDQILNELKRGMQSIQNKADCVIFVVKKDRFNKGIVDFFKIAQEMIFKNKLKQNSILLITNCGKGWVEQNRGNEHVKNALNYCNDKYYEFLLTFDNQYSDEEDKQKTLRNRELAANEFLQYIDSQDFNPIDLSYVQEAEFKNEWHESIFPKLKNAFISAFSKIFATLVDTVASKVADKAADKIDEKCSIQ
jgi:GTPase Era involved in 16S rRNA processing